MDAFNSGKRKGEYYTRYKKINISQIQVIYKNPHQIVNNVKFVSHIINMKTIDISSFGNSF